MGVVALMMAAMLLGTVCSPQAKRQKGRALLRIPTATSGPISLSGGSLWRPSLNTVQRKTEPKVRRLKATQTGGRSAPASLMRMNDAPHTAESKSISSASRSFTVFAS